MGAPNQIEQCHVHQRVARELELLGRILASLLVVGKDAAVRAGDALVGQVHFQLPVALVQVVVNDLGLILLLLLLLAVVLSACSLKLISSSKCSFWFSTLLSWKPNERPSVSQTSPGGWSCQLQHGRVDFRRRFISRMLCLMRLLRFEPPRDAQRLLHDAHGAREPRTFACLSSNRASSHTLGSLNRSSLGVLRAMTLSSRVGNCYFIDASKRVDSTNKFFYQPLEFERVVSDSATGRVF